MSTSVNGALPASTVVRYFTQRTISTSANEGAGAFGTGPSSRYNLKRLSFIFSISTIVFAMFTSNLSSDKIAHVHIYATTVLCVIFWIKLNIKMSNFLTIQKPNIRHFSVSDFTAALKSDLFMVQTISGGLRE